MQRLIGDESLQPRVLIAQPPQLLQFGQFHPAVLALPPMEGCAADVRLPADGRYRLAALCSAQDRYDLLRCVSFSFSFSPSSATGVWEKYNPLIHRLVFPKVGTTLAVCPPGIGS